MPVKKPYVTPEASLLDIRSEERIAVTCTTSWEHNVGATDCDTTDMVGCFLGWVNQSSGM